MWMSQPYVRVASSTRPRSGPGLQRGGGPLGPPSANKVNYPVLKVVRLDPTCLIRRGPPRGPHMSNVESLLMSVRTAAPSPRHPARMFLRPAQHSHIAAAYDSAAFDISLPTHTRAACARKADWFRLLARVGEKREQSGFAKQKAHEIESNPFGFIAAWH